MSLHFDHIRHLLIDLDGVLYRGQSPLGGSSDFIRFLQERSITFRLVTNNATLTPEQYVKKLDGMGIEVTADEVFTSSLATALYFRREDQSGKSVFVIGEDGIRTALSEIGMRSVEKKPDWVVVGLDRGLTYEKLATAALAINAGARFLGTNPDTSFPTERGLVPGAGAILALLTAATGVEPIVIGKPQPLMLQLAMESLGGSVQNTAMLGDRLDTDIQAADALTMPSILVLTGVSTREELAGSTIQPSLTLDDLPALMKLWPAAAPL